MAVNTQPIMMLTPFMWSNRLYNQVAAALITTEQPILLGTAGINGAIIETIFGIQLSGTGTLHLYTQAADETVPKLIVAPVSLASATVNVTLPNLLAPAKTGVAGNFTGLRLAPGMMLKAAVAAAISGDGFNIFAIGGHY